MIRLHNYDCLNVLKMMIEDEVFVDSIVTDPPYELGFMGRSWDSTGIAFQKETWELCFEVLKPGGHLLAFSGSRTYHRMAVAIEDAGFEIRDQVMWLYGSGFPKSMNVGKIIDKKLRGVGIGKSDPKSPLHGTKRQKIDGSNAKHDMSPLYKTQNVEYEYEHDISKQWDGWGTALKPAHEPIVMARKPLEGSNIDNVLKYGTGAINIDGCRIETDPEVDDMLREVERVQRDENNVWSNKNSGFKNENNNLTGVREDGRYPANLMHDGLQEDWARYFYCPKTSQEERNRGLENFTAKPMAWGNQAKAELKRGNLDFKGNQGDGSKHNKVAMRLNTHPTVKPQELMKYLCRLVTPKGGVVLDPFMGSGSTGMAAKDEGFDFIGIEKEKEYFEIAEARIKVSSPLMEFM